MSKEKLIQLIKDGREIEYIYNNKKYSITYGELNGKEVLSFCEYNKETTEVTTPEELLNIKKYGVSVEEMLASIQEDNIWIF